MLSAADRAKKWAENLGRSKTSIRAGIEGVTVAPTQKAAAAVDKYRDGCTKAADDGSFVAGCQRVTLQEWKDKAITKGLANLETGIRAGEPKVVAFQTKATPYYKQASERAAAVQGSGRSAAREKMEAVWDVMEELKAANMRG